MTTSSKTIECVSGNNLDNIRHFCEENYQWDNSETEPY